MGTNVADSTKHVVMTDVQPQTGNGGNGVLPAAQRLSLPAAPSMPNVVTDRDLIDQLNDKVKDIFDKEKVRKRDIDRSTRGLTEARARADRENNTQTLNEGLDLRADRDAIIDVLINAASERGTSVGERRSLLQQAQKLFRDGEKLEEGLVKDADKTIGTHLHYRKKAGHASADIMADGQAVYSELTQIRSGMAERRAAFDERIKMVPTASPRVLEEQIKQVNKSAEKEKKEYNRETGGNIFKGRETFFPRAERDVQHFTQARDEILALRTEAETTIQAFRERAMDPNLGRNKRDELIREMKAIYSDIHAAEKKALENWEFAETALLSLRRDQAKEQRDPAQSEQVKAEWAAFNETKKAYREMHSAQKDQFEAGLDEIRALNKRRH